MKNVKNIFIAHALKSIWIAESSRFSSPRLLASAMISDTRGGHLMYQISNDFRTSR
jgi:hypothetical protein